MLARVVLCAVFSACVLLVVSCQPVRQVVDQGRSPAEQRQSVLPSPSSEREPDEQADVQAVVRCATGKAVDDMPSGPRAPGLLRLAKTLNGFTTLAQLKAFADEKGTTNWTPSEWADFLLIVAGLDSCADIPSLRDGVHRIATALMPTGIDPDDLGASRPLCPDAVGRGPAEVTFEPHCDATTPSSEIGGGQNAEPVDISGTYHLTWSLTGCAGMDDSACSELRTQNAADDTSTDRIGNCEGRRCDYTDLGGGFGTVTLEFGETAWKGSGTQPSSESLRCEDRARPTTFTLFVSRAPSPSGSPRIEVHEIDVAAQDADCPSARVEWTGVSS